MPGPAGTVLSSRMFIVRKAIDGALLIGPACSYLLLAKAAAQPSYFNVFNRQQHFLSHLMLVCIPCSKLYHVCLLRPEENWSPD